MVVEIIDFMNVNFISLENFPDLVDVEFLFTLVICVSSNYQQCRGAA